ncbi:hypothetical protein VitviT2T_012245 [Vitis vinifera]|uniref:Dolichyl-diphosphooligosaccharide--protein glycosyltransferase subunit 4A n=11 Tax=Pentapetalae TaxID=1437201 RepID=A0ABY9CFI4_VITVI|nr:hypothetical protein VitviT2T_012245 [Vitis vinifera]
MYAHWEGPDYSRKAILDVPSSYESVLRLAAEKTSPRKVLVRFEMATEPKAAAENVKIDLLEDDDDTELNNLLRSTMFDDQDLGFFANFLGIFIFVLVIAYHYVMADPKYEGN